MPDKLKVLLLENDGNDAMIVMRELEEVAVVDVAVNGQAFREMLCEQFDCTLVDLGVPGITGIEAIRLARTMHPETPVIIVTGSVSARQADVACEAGAARFFLKSLEGLPGLATAVRDVCRHAQLKAEKEQLEAQSLRDNRLEIVGHTTTGFLHDLNNLLQIFVAGPGVLRKCLENQFGTVPVEAARILSTMESTGRRGAEMSRQLQAFVRGTNGVSRKPVNPEYLLTELGALLRGSFPKSIRLTIATAPGTSNVQCDATQIVQLLVNLAVNARDAMAGEGELHVSAQNAKLSVYGRWPTGHVPLQGDFVQIQVRDTGPGIQDNVLPRIFEHFFTTKELGKGTGLGLSLSQKIARDHGGDIEVKTGTGGTSFFVYLPVAIVETHTEAMHRLDAFDGEDRAVLIVDDEVSMRMMLDLLLADAGYKTLVAGSGIEALSLFRSGQQIDLMLTDLGMPYMDGASLTETLRAQGFTLPIICISGQADVAPELNVSRVLKKPFSRSELLQALQTALTVAPGGGHSAA